jgi:hypothetical protein
MGQNFLADVRRPRMGRNGRAGRRGFLISALNILIEGRFFKLNTSELISFIVNIKWYWEGHDVGRWLQLVETLCCKLEGRGFDSRWGSLEFFVDLIL